MAIGYTALFEAIKEYVYAVIIAHALPILTIIAVAIIVNKFSAPVIERLVRKIILADAFSSEEAERKRENTLIRIIHGATRLIVWIIALLTVLSEVGIEIGPILAAAGIVGVAVGFGGQYLIRDLISGFFIITENQYRIGDVVCFGETCGLVEDITLRMTILRDLDGVVHHVPHGEVSKVSNLSKGFARINVDIGVSYDSDLDKVVAVINEVGENLAKEPAWRDSILKPPQFLRVEAFADSAIIIKILGDTLPLKQWDVAGEFRRRLKGAFDREGIEIPFPQRVIHQAKR